MLSLWSIWTWFEIGVLTIGGFFVQLLLWVLTVPFDHRRAVVGRAFRLVGVNSARLTPLWRFSVSGPLPERSPRKTVVVSNHESNLDPFLISLLPWEMKWLSKAVLFKVPFVGWSMWLAGDVGIKRGVSSSAADAMKDCARWLERGMPVMIFPEGTRSKTPELLPFKDGAFRLAIETGAELLPIAIHGTRTALPKHSWRFGRSNAQVTVGKAISTEGMTLADVERLKAEARAQIEGLRAELGAALAGGRPTRAGQTGPRVEVE